ncbi:hypothetical protein C7C46_29350 [Streptomyces tateyamensis]|uniref:DUF2269 domain-containing protein n=1 Tax=Streptomyces tateyamensis TaxID=565073 RepID=A0A2V4NYG1_9ACTN|nr:hypothetical protein [Streptomyces tateyamensis]PYC68207.1 hypothetical protein C7C46_29350 [Streptomyces tateyamensis]
MAKFLLSLHVLAAVIAIGPVTVAASMFPRVARTALAAGPESGAAGSVRVLHRITQVYAAIGVAVPVLGIGTAQVMHLMSSAWIITSLVLTVLAALVVLVLMLPRQEAVVTALAGEGEVSSEADGAGALAGLKLLTMSTGLFSLLWAVVTVLMVVRPGSSTHA